MPARRPPHRRWYMRRQRFLDARGGRVTDIWLNLPLLPRRVLMWRAPGSQLGSIHMSFALGRGGRLLGAILVAGLVALIVRDITTAHLVQDLPEYVLLLTGLGAMMSSRQQARRAQHE